MYLIAIVRCRCGTTQNFARGVLDIGHRTTPGHVTLSVLDPGPMTAPRPSSVVGSARGLHSTSTLLLRKAPQAVYKIFGVPMSYIPWPSQLMKAIVRRIVKKEKLGDEKFQYTLFHRLSFLYAFCALSAFGLLVITLTKSEFKVAEDKPELQYGTADWYYLTQKNPKEITDASKIKKFKVQGFSLVEEPEFSARVERRMKESLEKAEESEDPVFRKMMGLPVNREDSIALKKFKEKQAKLEETAALSADQ